MELHKHFKLNSMLRYITVITVILFIVSTTVNGDVTATYDKPDEKMIFFDVIADDILTLVCTSSATLVWTKGGKDLSLNTSLNEDHDKTRHFEVSNNKLIIRKPRFEDDGTYLCTDPATKESAEIHVVANVYVKKLPENHSVVEGEKLKLHCEVLGTDPVIEWQVAKEISQEQLGKDKSGNKGGDGLFYESVDDLRDDRISFEKYEKVESDTLFINATTMEDRGRYNCTAKNKATNFRNSYIPAERGCYVRIKGKLAALWPFLGICAEVLILCAIILVYEKRRNKEGMDESDTDQSPEQEKLKTGK